MSNKISIGWPTLDMAEQVDTCGGFAVRQNNAMPTAQDLGAFTGGSPGLYLADDVFGNTILCADIEEGKAAPVIVDSNNVAHYPKPWILVPVVTNEYVGGHPPYVPKPPTK